MDYLSRRMSELQAFMNAGYDALMSIVKLVDSLQAAGYIIGPGRNAMGGSLVNYHLGLTQINPLDWNLSFPRFFNPTLQKSNILPRYEFDTDAPTDVVNALAAEQGLELNDNIRFYHLDILEKLNKAQASITGTSDSNFSLRHIPLDDEMTLDLFRKGDVSDIHLFQSPAMAEYLVDLKPDSFEELSALNAMYRPEQVYRINTFIWEKRNGFRETGNAVIDEIRRPTFGLIIYQEQIMELLLRHFGVEMENVDKFRIMLSKGHTPLSVKANYTSLLRREPIGKGVRAVAPRTFLKSHSIGQTMIAFRQAYIKVHYPDVYKNLF